MKREKQVILDTCVHADLDGVTIPDAIKVFQEFSRLYAPDYVNLRLYWNGDKMHLIGTREETDEEAQKREQSGVDWRESEIRRLEEALARLKGGQR